MLFQARAYMSVFAILIVRLGNATVRCIVQPEGGNVMFDAFEDELLELTVTERGHTAEGFALVGIPLCCSLVLQLSCSSSSSREVAS